MITTTEPLDKMENQTKFSEKNISCLIDFTASQSDKRSRQCMNTTQHKGAFCAEGLLMRISRNLVVKVENDEKKLGRLRDTLMHSSVK